MSHRGPDGPPDGWLFLIHQLPPKPDYVRVKVGRRLQRVGAIAIKNSVYVLPRLPEAYEDFEWIAREIGELGGEAVVSEARSRTASLTRSSAHVSMPRATKRAVPS